MELSMGDVAAALGTSCDTPGRMARGYSIDSRTLAAGQLFFAIRGPRLDGHEFVAQALERGAVGAVVDRGFRERAARSLAAHLVAVPDTTAALQELARLVRRRWGRRLVAVTGSIGKSTTKELIAALLSARFAVHKSPGNLNNLFGVPLTLLQLESRHEVAVVELAMSAAGEIAQLAQIALPQVGVVTNVAPVHLQFFDSVDSIARAKRELIENLERPAAAVLNYDDLRVRAFGEGFTGRVVTYGFEKGAEVRAVELRPGVNGGSEFRVEAPSFCLTFRLPLPGRHNVENALAALATTTLFDIAPGDVHEPLASFQNLHQRNEILTLPGGITLINDSYNSNPRAMEAMLETLAAWPAAKRRIVVAGEMLELGKESPDWHRKVGRKAVECGVDWLLAVQGDARFFLEGASEAGLAEAQGRFFATADEAAGFCRTLLQSGDVVLVKGSRAVHLETVTELLQAWRGKGSGPAMPGNRRSN